MRSRRSQRLSSTAPVHENKRRSREPCRHELHLEKRPTSRLYDGLSTSVRLARPSSGILVVQTTYVLPCTATSPFSFVSTSGLFSASMNVLWVHLNSCQLISFVARAASSAVHLTYLTLFAFQQCDVRDGVIPLPYLVLGQPRLKRLRMLTQG